VVEYILLLSMMVGIMVVLLRGLSSAYLKGVPKVGAAMERQLRTGAASAGVWRK
jgi:hypothetical protein